MDAPKCRLCGQRHWGGCAPQKGQADGKVDRRAPALEVQPHPVDGDIRDTVASKRPMTKPAFDRTAYQREYMRKRRAKQPH